MLTPRVLLPLHLCIFSCCFQLCMALAVCNSQLSAMDVSVRSTMKGAAKCDKHCELQNSVNRQGLERILCFWDIPESMPASVSMLYCSSGCGPFGACCCDCLRLRMCSLGTSEASDVQGATSAVTFLSIHLRGLVFLSLSRALFSPRVGDVCVRLQALVMYVCAPKRSRHEVRLANPLNLSI